VTSLEPKIVAGPETWMESDAVEQLRAVARLPGMTGVVGMPDLHPGKGSPIGAAFVSSGCVYPHLVGSDIGCGMGLWTTDQPAHRLKLDRIEKTLDLEGAYQGSELRAVLAEENVAEKSFADSLGTIGGGNHFAELLRVTEVNDEGALAALGIHAKMVSLLVHSGSRGLGAAILRAHTDHRGAEPLSASSAEGLDYLARHDDAARWARSNRRLIALRMLEGVGCAGTRVLDVVHNSVEPCPALGADCYLHRKGAAPADRGAVVIPGSRGDQSYLVEPLGDGVANLRSLAHGAGRKWQRSAAKGKLGAKADASRLLRTRLGSRVICEDKQLLFEEAPEAYKAIEQVIAPLQRAGMLRVIAVLTPLLTYKTRR